MFFNPFSSKRRREADEAITELAATGDATSLAPDTPPSSGAHLPASPATAATLGRASAPAAAPATLGDSTIKVRARAEYFEDLIRARTSGGGGAAAPGPQPALVGGLTAAAAADALATLRSELARVEGEKAAALAAARRAAAEVEALRGVVRQLSESRAAALTARATLAEHCSDLQRAHERVTRVADLSRAVSKENLELTRNARGAAAAAAKEAAEARREAAAAGAAEVRAAVENEALRRRLGQLERVSEGHVPDAHGSSACRREFTAAKVIETY